MKKKIPICFVFLVSLLFFVSVSFALVPGLEMEQNEQNEMMPMSINNSTAMSSAIMDTNAQSATLMTTTNTTETYFKPEKKEIIKIP